MESESRIRGKEKRTEIAPLGASAEAKVAKVVALIEKNEDER